VMAREAPSLPSATSPSWHVPSVCRGPLTPMCSSRGESSACGCFGGVLGTQCTFLLPEPVVLSPRGYQPSLEASLVVADRAGEEGGGDDATDI